MLTFNRQVSLILAGTIKTMYTGSNNVVTAASLAGKDTGIVSGGYSRKYNGVSFKDKAALQLDAMDVQL